MPYRPVNEQPPRPLTLHPDQPRHARGRRPHFTDLYPTRCEGLTCPTTHTEGPRA